jgi:alpha-ketoglutarate-dependent taurine dioxygenase
VSEEHVLVQDADFDLRADADALARLVAPARLADSTAACEWLERVKAPLSAALGEHGAVLVKGLQIADVDDFARARDALIARRASYKEKATPRSDFGSAVLSSTDLPPSQPIRLHNEISYTLEFPRVLLFGCLTAPETGGATPIGDVRAVLRHLPDDLVERFAQRGWLLTRHYDGMMGLPWEEAFGTDDRAAVDRYCEENLIGTTWLDDGRLRTTQRRSAVVTHPVTGERVWFNHIAFWNQWTLDDEIREMLVDEYDEDGLPFNTYYGDGAPIAEQDVRAMNDAYDSATVREAWEVGDLLMVDNIAAAHGRESFGGPRHIVVAMGEPVPLADCAPTVAPTPSAVAG